MPPRYNKNAENTANKTNSPPSMVQTSDAQEDQFETELTFCIDQLQKVLDDSQTGQKKSESWLRWFLEVSSRALTFLSIHFAEDETQKAINILKNPKQLKIKKRQLMKQYVGDYRAKMADQASETKSSSDGIDIKLKNIDNNDSTFIKKAVSNPQLSKKQEFLFNFKLETTSIFCDELNLEEETNGKATSDTVDVEPMMDLKDSKENEVGNATATE